MLSNLFLEDAQISTINEAYGLMFTTYFQCHFKFILWYLNLGNIFNMFGKNVICVWVGMDHLYVFQVYYNKCLMPEIMGL